jgi:hypothetical protein
MSRAEIKKLLRLVKGSIPSDNIELHRKIDEAIGEIKVKEAE